MQVKKLINSLPAGALTVTVTAAVLYLTLVPDPVPDNNLKLFPGADKVVHGIMMAGIVWAATIDRARYCARHKNSNPPKAPLTLYLVATILFGGVIELLQLAMDMGRGAEWADFAADSIGAFAAYIISRLSWQKLVSWITAP